MRLNSPIINSLIRENFKASSLKLCELRRMITMYKNFALEIQKVFRFFLEVIKLTKIKLLYIFNTFKSFFIIHNITRKNNIELMPGQVYEKTNTNLVEEKVRKPNPFKHYISNSFYM